MPRRLLASLLVLSTWAAVPEAAGRGWGRPVDGRVVAGFRFDPAAPFARGARRGVDLAAPSGSGVVAACSGRVSHAGAVPRWGRGVTVRCGHLAATHLGLAHVAVRRGERIRRGAPLGTAAGPVLRVGARRTGDRRGWVAPPLPGARPSAPPPATFPAPRGGNVTHTRTPAPARAPVPPASWPATWGAPSAATPERRAATGSTPVPTAPVPGALSAPPLLAWAALLAAALATPGTLALRRRRARRPRRSGAAARAAPRRA